MEGRGYGEEGQRGEGADDEARLDGVVQVLELPPARGEPGVEQRASEGPEPEHRGPVAGGGKTSEGQREGLLEVAEEHAEDEEEEVDVLLWACIWCEWGCGKKDECRSGRSIEIG